MTYGVWYFILAHEVAHNLVQLHNSEREFYFPTICEKYLVSLFRILNAWCVGISNAILKLVSCLTLIVSRFIVLCRINRLNNDEVHCTFATGSPPFLCCSFSTQHDGWIPDQTDSHLSELCNWLRLSQADLQLHLHLDGSSLGAWSVNNNFYLHIYLYLLRPIGHLKSLRWW